jgi:hypothetical protein
MRRLTMITPMLAIAFALPAFAQQSNVVEPLARQQAEAIVLQYLTAVNQGDAQAVAALHTGRDRHQSIWQIPGSQHTVPGID